MRHRRPQCLHPDRRLWDQIPSLPRGPGGLLQDRLFRPYRCSRNSLVEILTRSNSEALSSQHSAFSPETSSSHLKFLPRSHNVVTVPYQSSIFPSSVKAVSLAEC